MTTAIDHPRLRESTTCPLCGQAKDQGTLVCWPCYRTHALKYGNAEIEAKLDELEMRT